VDKEEELKQIDRDIFDLYRHTQLSRNLYWTVVRNPIIIERGLVLTKTTKP
jgi:hypothetical protein